MDWFESLDQDGREAILKIMNYWWNGGELDEELLQAKVVHIYKKGDTSKFENYRPISLLNSILKIYAALVRNRLIEGMEKASNHPIWFSS